MSIASSRTMFWAFPSLFFFLVNTLLAQPILEKIPVFPAHMNEVSLYRIPGVLCTKQGSLLAYCEARLHGKSDWGEIEVHLRRSKDLGRTWGPSVQIAHHGPRIEGNPKKRNATGAREQTVNNPVAIMDHHTGHIELLYCVNYSRCFSIRSTDDGISWSQPVEITETFEAFRSSYNWKVIATGPGHGIQTSTGRLVVPIWLAYGKEGDHAPSAAATIYSDDHGQSWQAGEIVFPNKAPLTNPNETMIATLSNGDVLLVNRNVSRPNRKLIATSKDGATQWSEPVFHPELWEPVCMASITAFPQQPGTLLFTCPRKLAVDQQGQEIPAGRGKREKLSIQLSRDDGKSWPILKTIEAGPSAYSDLAVLPDGSIICLYEGLDTIVAARFNLEWVSSP